MLERFLIKSIISFSEELKAKGLFLLFLILFNNMSLFQFNQKDKWLFITSFLISLFEKAIYESCRIKKDVVEKDEKEKGLRKTLNFGHTFAHAYEATLGYSKKLNHGEAVILGMKTALNFSLKHKLLKKTEHNSIINHITKLGLPSKINKYKLQVNHLLLIIAFLHYNINTLRHIY